MIILHIQMLVHYVNDKVSENRNTHPVTLYTGQTKCDKSCCGFAMVTCDHRMGKLKPCTLSHTKKRGRFGFECHVKMCTLKRLCTFIVDAVDMALQRTRVREQFVANATRAQRACKSTHNIWSVY